MDLQKAVISEIVDLVTVYSPKKRVATVKNRFSYAITFCADNGQITYTQNGACYVENKTHALLLPEEASYSLYGDITGNFPVINFYTLHPITDTITVFEISNQGYLLSCYNEMKRLFGINANQAKIFSLLYEIIHELSYSKGSDILDPAIDFINENYCNSDISNTLLAKKCKISEVYFRKLFKEKTGTTPKQYILSLRLSRAKQLLGEGKQKIWAISSDCGFESSAHFCRSFKEQFGITPSEYRKKQYNGI